MLVLFSSPLLILSPDALRELQGGETLPGLWTLFTKCKESLQDGRRLENISWRLWHREMATSQQYSPLTPKSVSPVLSEKSGAGAETFPTPHGETIRSDDYSQLPEMHHRSVFLTSAPVPHVRAASHQIDDRYTKPFSLSFGRPRSVGKIICDMLPSQIPLPSAKFAASTTSPNVMFLPTPTTEYFPAVAATANAPLPPPAQATDKLPAVVHPAIPSVCLPSTPPDTDRGACPRVVVVDPTPNPTPHPTPPTTPVFKSAAAPTLTPVPAAHPVPSLPRPVMTHVSSSSSSSSSSKPPVPSSSLSLSRPAQLPPALSQQQQPQQQQQPPPPPSPLPAHPTAPAALKPESLKPSSDRRFFLQQSPDGGSESPERREELHKGGEEEKSISDRTSTSTSRSRSSGSSPPPNPPKASAESKRVPVRLRKGKGKEAARHAPVRAKAAHNGRPPQLRRAATLDGGGGGGGGGGKARATFSVGSTSSHGSKGVDKTVEAGAGAGAGREVKAKVVAVSPPKTANPPQRRRVVVASTSSEYETTDTDDESWAEEEAGEGGMMSVEDAAKTKEDVQLREAAMEVKRLRELFAKVPKRSYSNLNRTRSGLLSQLLNPDPTIFPPNHPYRTSFSTQDFSQLPRHNHNNHNHGNRRADAPPLGLHTSKSAAVLPMTALVTAHVGSVTSGNGSGDGSVNGYRGGGGGGVGHRPKGRPQGQEMEDDTDSGDENPDDGIQVSRSFAQQKLAELAAQQKFGKALNGASAATMSSSTTTSTSTSAGASASTTSTASTKRQVPVRPVLQHVATAPIPLCHPYNLPAPAPPSTPRTTRRQMLHTELSESLRRNLLWERQVSNVNGGVRRQSSGAIGGLRPLTSTTTTTTMMTATSATADVVVVQVSEKAKDGNGGEVLGNNNNNRRSASEKQEEKQRAMARHRSWADDYHSKGW